MHNIFDTEWTVDDSSEERLVALLGTAADHCGQKPGC
jgi:hypothetical protein